MAHRVALTMPNAEREGYSRPIYSGSRVAPAPAVVLTGSERGLFETHLTEDRIMHSKPIWRLIWITDLLTADYESDPYNYIGSQYR